MRRLSLLGLSLALLALVGCQRLNYSKQFTIDSQISHQEVEFDPPSRSQTITVTAKSDKEINVYVVLTEDKERAVSAVVNKKQPPSTLASEEEAKEINLEATIPAKKGFLVLISTGKEVSEAKFDLVVKGR